MLMCNRTSGFPQLISIYKFHSLGEEVARESWRKREVGINFCGHATSEYASCRFDVAE